MNTLPKISTEYKKIVKCACGKTHAIDSNTFFTVYGNICIGLSGGLVGNNFITCWQGVEESLAMRNFDVLGNASIYCLDCLINYLAKTKEEVNETIR